MQSSKSRRKAQARNLNRLKIIRPTRKFREQCGRQVVACQQVYSYLAYRSRNSLTASIRDIRDALKLDHRTAVNALEALGPLAESTTKGWKAVEPPDGLFVTRKTAKAPNHWSGRFAYNFIELPTVNRHRATLWGFLKSRQIDGRISGFTILGAATLCGSSRWTVKRHLTDLEKEGIVSWDGADLLVRVDQEPKAKPAKPHGIQLKGNDWDVIRQKFVADGRINGQGEAIIRNAALAGYDPISFRERFADLQARDASNMASATSSPKANFEKYVLVSIESQLKAKAGVSSHVAETTNRIPTAEEMDRRAENQANERRAALGNPLAQGFNPREEHNIYARVGWPGKNKFVEWDKIRMALSQRIGERWANVQDRIESGGNMTDKIVRNALHQLNHHYGKETRASEEEFRAVINQQLEANGFLAI